MVVEVSDQSFKKEVLESDLPVLVDFWAEWCGPCKVLAPILDEVSQELGTKVKIAKINIDHNPEIPTKYMIRGIPTMIIFKGGKDVSTKVGVINKSVLVDWINANI